MYDNIGEKIKSLAIGTFIVEALAAVIAGLTLIASGPEFVPTGILVLVAGPIVAWFSSWLLYGFGHLITNSDIVAAACKQKDDISKPVITPGNPQQSQQRKETKPNPASLALSSNDEFIDIICPHCNAELSFPKQELQNGEIFTCPMCNIPIK